MAALLVALSVMAITMTAAMPVWHHAAQREKELELEFRGGQYARAIALFQRKSGPGVLPPNLDVLLDQKFLRKKYKDPITGEDFVLLRPTQQSPTDNSGRGRQSGPPSLSGAGGTGTGRGNPNPLTGGAVGGIMGVASKSTAESIRIRDGRNHYNEWSFTPVNQTLNPGGQNNPNNPGGQNPNDRSPNQQDRAPFQRNLSNDPFSRNPQNGPGSFPNQGPPQGQPTPQGRGTAPPMGGGGFGRGR